MQNQNANTVPYLFGILNYVGEIARMSSNSRCAHMWQLNMLQEHQNIFNSVGVRRLIS